MNLLEIEKNIKRIEEEIIAENERYEKTYNKLEKELVYYKDLKSMDINGVNINRVLNAKKFVKIEGLKNLNYGECRNQIERLIRDLINSDYTILKEYYGCKDYAGFVCQAVNCQYGYSPTHGYVVFRIEATNAWRKAEIEPTDEDLSDIIYYLNVAHDGKIKEMKK